MEKYRYTPKSDLSASGSYISTPESASVELSGSKKRKPESPLKVLYDSLDGNKGDNTNILRQLIQAIEVRTDELEETVTKQTDTIKALTTDNECLQSRCQISEGRVTRLEKLVDDLREETLQINARSMKDNLIFHGIQETQPENVKEVLLNFLQTDMVIKQPDLNDIIIHKVHRMGGKDNESRAIIANINDAGRIIIWKHLKNLKGKPVSVFTQLPRELVERKQRLLPKFKDARTHNLKPKWAGAKLIINDTVTQVKRDTVTSINMDTTDQATKLRVIRAPPSTYDGSKFQGSSVPIFDPDEIIPALHAIYRDTRNARATHNIYAYRLRAGKSSVEHYEDDGEYGAGRKLLTLLQENKIENQLVCVSRWYAGKHLGPARFGYIIEAATNVIELST